MRLEWMLDRLYMWRPGGGDLTWRADSFACICVAARRCQWAFSASWPPEDSSVCELSRAPWAADSCGYLRCRYHMVRSAAVPCCMVSWVPSSRQRRPGSVISYLCCVAAAHHAICKDIHRDWNALYRLSSTVKSNKTHYNHKMRINPIKTLCNTCHKSYYMDKNERVRLRLSAIRTCCEELLNSYKNTYKNPLNPDLSSKSDPETSVEFCRKSPQKTAWNPSNSKGFASIF